MELPTKPSSLSVHNAFKRLMRRRVYEKIIELCGYWNLTLGDFNSCLIPKLKNYLKGVAGKFTVPDRTNKNRQILD